MVDFSKGPMLYGAIGVAAVVAFLILCCCCCRSHGKKDDELCLTPTHLAAVPNSKYHYALDMEATAMTSPATLQTKKKSFGETESYAPMLTSPLSAPSRDDRKSVSRSDERKSIRRRESELFATIRSSTTTLEPPQNSSDGDNNDNGSDAEQPPVEASASPPRKSFTDQETERSQPSKPPIVAAPLPIGRGLQLADYDVMPTSPVQRSASRHQRQSFAGKQSELVPTSPVQRKSTGGASGGSSLSLTASDMEWYTPMSTTPSRHSSQRRCKTERLEDDPVKTPRRIQTPKRKKSVTFEMPEDEDPKPTTPRVVRTSRSSILSSGAPRSQPVDPFAIAEDPVVMASRLPFETIKTEQLLSKDGFGEVYRGSYRDSVVTIKRLLPDARRDVAKIQSLLREVQLLAAMDHAHIVQFIGVAWDAFSDVCVVTEHMDGGDLRTALDQFNRIGRPLGFDKQKATIALHVAHALTYLHSLERTVLYRDIKSKNILLDNDQTLAKLTNCSGLKEWQDGTMSAGVGTALWMAPEVLTGLQYDHKADVFSFGILLSELDTYLLPYADFVLDDAGVEESPVTSTVLLHRILAGKASVTFSKDLRRDVRELGHACVRLDPTQRPTSAAVLYALQKIERTMESEISIAL